MGKGNSPEPKEFYERQARRLSHVEFLKELGSRQATVEDEWLRSVFNEEKEKMIKEQKRLVRNARARARRAERKANIDPDE